MNANKTLIISGSLIAVLILIIAAVAAIITHNRGLLSPSEVANRFYANWAEMAGESPQAPIDQKLHLRSTYVTDAFGSSIQDAVAAGENPLSCVLAGDITTVPGNDRPEGTSVSIRLNGKPVALAILIEDARGWWRIDEMECL